MGKLVTIKGIFVTFSFIALLNYPLLAGNGNNSPSAAKEIHVFKTEHTIALDGQLTEKPWLIAQPADQFHQNFPGDTSLANSKTIVKITYDDEFLYIGAICYDSIPGKYVTQSLRRDFSYPDNDLFAVYISPFNDNTNGFTFAVTPYGVKREGLIAGGGQRGSLIEWDNKWFVEVSNAGDKWVVEMAIPFKSIRYKENSTSWRINFARNDLKRNENSSWAPVPRNFNTSTLTYAGTMYWEEPPEKAGGNFSIIPYGLAEAEKDYLQQTPASNKFNGGLDAKVAVTSSLNLDLTVNPDFSHVEVDRQVTNLTRFNLFFPERRNFFLENSDLFSQFGFSKIRPFFSRRIGLHNGERVPIYFGARLSGKVNKNWRIGAMNMQTAEKEPLNLSSQNYSVAAFQRQIFGNSNIAGIFVNRQRTYDKGVDFVDYNRIIGLDYNLASKDYRWMGKAFLHKSLTPDNLDKSTANATWLMYNSRKIFAMWNHEYVGKNYIADVGFVPRLFHTDFETGEIFRKTYWRLEPLGSYHIYPKSGRINKVSPGFYTSVYTDSAYRTTEALYELNTTINWQSTSVLEIKFGNNRSRLLFPTDITRTGDTLLPKGYYTYNNFQVAYGSNLRKVIVGRARLDIGNFYNGRKLSMQGEVTYRLRPYGIFGLSYSHDIIELPGLENEINLVLLGPTLDLTFTRNIFFSTFIQYNTQQENLNINSRLQWRFRPLSDFYLVYTDNYDTLNFGKKTRALVLKLVYWLNV